MAIINSSAVDERKCSARTILVKDKTVYVVHSVFSTKDKNLKLTKLVLKVTRKSELEPNVYQIVVLNSLFQMVNIEYV